MKFFVAFAALVALTVAVPLAKPVDHDMAQLEAIIAAIQSPSTDPATAALLEEQLYEIIAAVSPIAVGPAIIAPVVRPEPIAVGPAIIAPVVRPEPIAVGPAIIAPVVRPEPIAVGPAITAPVVSPPVVVGEIPDGASPLVQIIVNVNKATADIPVSPIVSPAPVSPIVRPEPIGRPVPVGDLEIPVEPEQVVEVSPIVRPEPIGRPVPVATIPIEPVQVVEVAPVPVEPVQIGVPIIPEAAVVLPEQLN